MSRRPLRHWSRLGVACIALLVFSETLLLLASRAGGPVDVDIGPSTEDYLSGFAESEERPGVSFRWTHETASVSTFLLSSQGEGAVVLRYGRFLDGMARVRLFVDGQPAGSFEARPGRFRIQRLPVRFNGNPVRVELLTEDPAPAGRRSLPSLPSFRPSLVACFHRRLHSVRHSGYLVRGGSLWGGARE